MPRNDVLRLVTHEARAVNGRTRWGIIPAVSADHGLVSESGPSRLAVAVLAVGGAAIRVAGIVNTLPTAVGNMPLPDDAFYYLVLARNLALGRGWVVSGSGEPTTGFQPLWATLLGGLEAATGGLNPGLQIQAAQALGAAVGMATALVIYRLARRLAPGSMAALVATGSFLLSPQVVKHNLNGMETSLTLLGMAVLLWTYTQVDPGRATGRGLVGVGVLSGIAALARVDLAVLAAAGIGWWCLRPGSETASERGRRLLAIGAGLGLALMPWSIAAADIGAGPIPESGGAVRTLTLLLRGLPPLGTAQSLLAAPSDVAGMYLTFGIEFTSAWVRQVPALLPLTLPVFAFLDRTTAEAVSAAMGGIALLGLVMLAARSSVRGLRIAVGLWMVYALGLTLAYSTVILGPWFFQRYVAPLAVGFHIVVLSALIGWLPERRPRRLATAAISAGIGLSFAALIWGGSYRWILEGPAAVPDDGFFRAAVAIEEQLPPGSRIGVFSAGLLSYTLDQPVIALDGKVSAGARKALTDGSMLTYLCAARVEYLADWERMIDRLVRRRSVGWDDNYLTTVLLIEVEDGNDILVQRLEPAACEG